MATTLKTDTQVPTDLREWLRKVDEIGELQVVTGANAEEEDRKSVV